MGIHSTRNGGDVWILVAETSSLFEIIVRVLDFSFMLLIISFNQSTFIYIALILNPGFTKCFTDI